jgi:hypothetical protein
MAIPLRGLRDIRTLSGRANETLHPHTAYMRITCLEMERARRNKERASAVRLVEKIDTRFKEIEAEKDRLLRAVGERSVLSAATQDATSQSRPHGKAAGLRFRY